MDLPDTMTLLYASTLAGTAWGGGLLASVRPWREEQLRTWISLGAGVLLGATFLHLLPAVSLQDPTGRYGSVWVLGGFLVLFLLEKFVMVHPCEEGGCDVHRLGAASLVGLSFHNLVTGLTLGASLVAPRVGFPVLLALLLHKLPESFALGAILLAGGRGARAAAGWLGLYAAMILVGAVGAVAVLPLLGPGALPAALAVSAGTFLHIAVSDLLPEVHRVESQRGRNLVVFLLGLGGMALLRGLE